MVFFLIVAPVPGPVTEITFQRVSDSEIIVSWRVPEITNGMILNYNITVTLYSSGEVVYTSVVAAGGQLSDRVTGLGEVHSSIMCYDLVFDTNMRSTCSQHAYQSR